MRLASLLIWLFQVCAVGLQAGSQTWAATKHAKSQDYSDMTEAASCTPTKENLQAGLLASTGNSARKLSFYLHEWPYALFGPSIKCFFASVGLREDEDLLDDHFDPDTAEHITDIRMFAHLREHKSRSLDHTAADIHIVGAPLTTSWHVANLPSHPCGSLQDHLKRVNIVEQKLRSIAQTLPHGVQDLLFISTDWRWPDVTITHSLKQFMASGPAMLATADAMFAKWTGIPANRTVIIPYKASRGVEDAAFDQQSLLDAATGTILAANSQRDSKRFFVLDDVTSHANGFHRGTRHDGVPARISHTKLNFTFNGRLDRNNEGGYRWVLRNLTADLPGVSVNDVKSYDVANKTQLVDNTTTALLSSAFCLVPAGDTATSRRLFEALAAGCVPIFFGKFNHIAKSLPFKGLIDWSELVVFAGSLECIAGSIKEHSAWLKSLTDENWASRVGSMRKRGQQVFVSLLSYRGQGVADGMLDELARMRYLLLNQPEN